MASETLLDVLRSHSQVDCDTLDVEVAKSLGPFVDCTSNQAIAYLELQRPLHASLIQESIQVAKELYPKYASEVPFEELAVEIMTIKLSSKMVPYLTGYTHIQTNPYNSYSTDATVTNAKRIISLYAHILPNHPSERVCIKIPSTWEGLHACQILESQGIHTLATTLFTTSQAVLASHVNCTYIAPYINGLPVHFVPGYVDANPGFEIARKAQQYFETINSKTKVLPASLTTVDEVMKLAGAHHITVSPPLLTQLATTASPTTYTAPQKTLWFLETDADADVDGGTNGNSKTKKPTKDWKNWKGLTEEAIWRMEFSRCEGGTAEKKLIDAINIFADMQDGMVAFVKSVLADQGESY